MSRSYRKTPYSGDTPLEGSKRRANKKVRRALKNHDFELRNKEYRKVYQTWDIRDYKEIAPSFETFYRDQLDRWYNPRIWYRRRKDTPPTREECRRLYDRWYRRK